MPVQQNPERQRRLADMLRQQSSQPLQGQMVSGHYVAPSWTQGLNQLFQGYASGKLERQADQTEEERRKALMSALKGDNMPPESIRRPGVEPEPLVERLSGLENNPRAQELAEALRLSEAEAEQKAQFQTPPSSFREYQLSQQDPNFREFLSSTGSSNIPSSLQEFNAYQEMTPEEQETFLRLKRTQPKAEITKVQNPDGSTTQMIFDPTERTLSPLSTRATSGPATTRAGEGGGTVQEDLGRGLTPREETEQKARGEQEVKEEVKQEARGRVTSNLQTLSGYYGELQDMGAAIDVENPTAENIQNSIAASPIGQTVSQYMGTRAQSIRQKINNMQPLLIQEIRKATEMGARGLDSNRELSFYLQAATDPSRDLQSNLAAIQVLDEAYGLGEGVEAPDNKVEQLKEEFNEEIPEEVDAETWQYMTPQEKELFR